MAKIGIFFGSNTGTTELVASILKKSLNKYAPNVQTDVHDIGLVDVTKMLEYEKLILASPTWNTGELQDDWNLKFESLNSLDMKGKDVALLGVGDQFGYPDNFIDAIGQLGDKMAERGADLVGFTPTAGFEYGLSQAEIDPAVFNGLAIDDVNQVDQTPHRLNDWVIQLLFDFGMIADGTVPQPTGVE